MKSIKKNKYLIISLLILLSLLLYNIVNIVQEDNMRLEYTKEIQEKCKKDLENKDQLPTLVVEVCERSIKGVYPRKNFWETYEELMTKGGMQNIPLFLCLFVIIPSLYQIIRLFKNNVLSNCVTRESLKKIRKKLLQNAYKSIFIITSIVIVALLFSFIYTKTYVVSQGIPSVNLEYSSINSLTYSFVAIALVFMSSALYINIGLIIARKYHNFFLAILLTFITIIGIEAFLAIGISNILFSILFSETLPSIISIINIITFVDVYGVYVPLITPTICLIISFVILHFQYKNKEKLIIDCEKN